MDFGLSQDQLLLEKTVRRFLADRVPIAHVRALRDAGRSSDAEIWKGLAELGVAGIVIGEEHGGSDLTLLDAVLVAQALGHAVTPSRFLTSGVMAPMVLRAAAGGERDVWLAGIASGELTFGVAATEVFSVREGAGVVLRDGRLRGKAMMALDTVGADYVLIPVDGARLAVAAGKARGLEMTRLTTLDATRCTAELVLENVEPEAVLEDAGEPMARMLSAGRVALAADTLGACEAMVEQAVAYAQVRQQFGRVIGSFQAVKHLCAEMVAELEPARSLLWYAAHSFDAIPEEAPHLACHALAHISEMGRAIASIATQVHGGIGWTDEQNLHFWYKRIAVARHLLGGPVALRARAAELQGLTPPPRPPS